MEYQELETTNWETVGANCVERREIMKKTFRKCFVRKNASFFKGQWKQDSFLAPYKVELPDGSKYELFFRRRSYELCRGGVRDPLRTSYRISLVLRYWPASARRNNAIFPQHEDIELIQAAAVGETERSRDRINGAEERIIEMAKRVFGIERPMFTR